jgi:hypothetical protein
MLVPLYSVRWPRRSGRKGIFAWFYLRLIDFVRPLTDETLLHVHGSFSSGSI